MKVENDFGKQFLRMLDQKAGLSRERIEHLTNRQEFHEVVLERIRLNMYTLFRTMFLNSLNPNPRIRIGSAREIMQQYPESPERCYYLFLNALEFIPASWKQSLAQAREHDDAETIVKEETKLAVVDEIRRVFQNMFSVSGGAS